MPTVIDSLSVVLGLDNTKFKKGIKESETVQKDFDNKTKSLNKQQSDAQKKEELQKEKFHKLEMERNKKVLEGFTKLRNEAIAFLAIFTAGKGLIDFARDVISTTATLSRMSDTFDVSMHDLGGWDLAMKQLGGSAEDSAALIEKAGEAVGAYGLGRPNDLIKGMQTMAGGAGIHLDLKGVFKDTKSVLIGLNQIISAWYSIDHLKAFAMTKETLGITGAPFQLLKLPPSEFKKKLDEGARVEGLTKQLGKYAEEADAKWAAIGERLKEIGRVVVLNLSGPMGDLVNKFASFLENKENLDALTTAMKSFGDAVNKIDLKNLTLTPQLKVLLDALHLALEGVSAFVQLLTILGVGAGNVAGAAVTGTNPASVLGKATNYVKNPYGLSNFFGLVGSSTTTSTSHQTNVFNIYNATVPTVTANAIKSVLQANTGTQ